MTLRTAGTDQRVIGGALDYVIDYDKSGKPAKTTITNVTLPGVVSSGVTFQLDTTAVPPGTIGVFTGSAAASATHVVAQVPDLGRAAHGAMDISLSAVRDVQGPPTASAGSISQGCIDALADANAARKDLLDALYDLNAQGGLADALTGAGESGFFLPVNVNPLTPPPTAQNAEDAVRDAQDDFDHATAAAQDACKDREPGEPFPDPSDDNIFNIDGDGYIDPSGLVRTRAGAPIEDAKVVLQHARVAKGPYAALRDGDVRMSPANRHDPDTTDIDGHFGWDVLPGFYRVKATRRGCSGSVTSKARPIPPPVSNLRLTLDCPKLHRATTRTTVERVARSGPSTVVRVHVRSARQVLGQVDVKAPGTAGGHGFLHGKRGIVTVVLPGHVKRGAHLIARYAGNARTAPSHGKR